MDRRRLRFTLLGTGVVLTMGLLLAVAVSQPDGLVYYLSVSEFLDSPSARQDGARVNGTVASGSIERLPTGEDVRFVMRDKDSDRTIPVVYHGVIPDTFVDRADVVVEGGLDGDGTLQAELLLAKCPSKYEAAGDAVYTAEPATQP